MAKKHKRLMGFIVIPLIFAFLSYILLFTVLSPMMKPVFSIFQLMSSEKGADFYSLPESIYSPSSISEGTVSLSQIEFPVYGAHYASIQLPGTDEAEDLYFGDSNAVLKKGIGQYMGSFLPGYGSSILLTGHNNTYFHNLKNVKEGDVFTITTSYGVYEYKVTGTAIKTRTDKTAYDLNQQKEQLILYTCYPFNALGLTSQRYFVYADKISGPEIVD